MIGLTFPRSTTPFLLVLVACGGSVDGGWDGHDTNATQDTDLVGPSPGDLDLGSDTGGSDGDAADPGDSVPGGDGSTPGGDGDASGSGDGDGGGDSGDADSGPVSSPFVVHGSVGASDVTVLVGGTSTLSDAAGRYTLSNLEPGLTTVRPLKAGCSFTPPQAQVTVGAATVTQSFTATCASAAPAPKPIDIPYTLGAYYMPKPREPNHQWADLRQFNAKNATKPGGQRMPLLGYYQGDSPLVLDWHIKWAVDRGITYFVFDDYWTQSVDAPLQEGSLRAFLAAPHRSAMQFAVAIWWNDTVADTGAARRARFLDVILPYYVRHYLAQPNYLLVDGKPAIYVGERTVIFGDSTNLELTTMMASADAYIAAHTPYSGATWIVTAHGSCGVDFGGAAAGGFDAVAPYYVLPGVFPCNVWDITAPADPNTTWPAGKAYADLPAYAATKHAEAFVEAGARAMKFIPSVTSDFDTRWAWWLGSHVFFSGQNQLDYWNMLGAVRAVVDTHPGATAIATRTGKPMVGLGAWNEWLESSSLEPGRAAVQANDNPDPFFYATAAAKQFGGPASGYDELQPGELELGWVARDTWVFDSATGAGPELWTPSVITVGPGNVGELSVDSAGPVTIQTATNIVAADYRELRVRLAVVSGGPLTLLHFRWLATDYSETADEFGAPQEAGRRSYDQITGHGLACTPVDGFCEYTFSLPALASWRGRLRGFELRFQGATRPTRIALSKIGFVR